MTDLYETLDVSRDAPAAVIKQAYRKLAQQHHPDKGGDHETFQQIQKAYDVLGDPDRRARYDATGKTDQQSSMQEQARGIAAQMVNETIDMLLQKGGDPATTDVIKVMRNHMREAKQQNDATIAKMHDGVAARETAMARFTRREGGDNLLVLALQGGIEQLRQQVAQAEEQQKLLHTVLDVLAEYDYKVDAKPMRKALNEEDMQRIFRSHFVQFGP